jgi:hypothetical protein
MFPDGLLHFVSHCEIRAQWITNVGARRLGCEKVSGVGEVLDIEDDIPRLRQIGDFGVKDRRMAEDRRLQGRLRTCGHDGIHGRRIC